MEGKLRRDRFSHLVGEFCTKLHAKIYQRKNLVHVLSDTRFWACTIPSNREGYADGFEDGRYYEYDENYGYDEIYGYDENCGCHQ